MQYQRREFIKLTGQITAGVVLLPSLSDLFSGDENKLNVFGIQLYTLRDDMPKQPKEVLKKLAGFGYKQIESYEGDQGMFWGMSNTEFKKYMDELGMTIVSSHCDIYKNFERKVTDAAAIGMKYLICPYIDAQKTIADYKKIADKFNECGEICRRSGIKFAYHNHDHDFKIVEGQVAQDIFMKNTDPSLVDFEMDIYWVVTAGHDPEKWLKKYPNRFRLCHVKDRVKGTKEREASCTLGTGSINFPKILKTARKNGMQYYIVEQEHYKGTTPIESSRANAVYMKKLPGFGGKGKD